MYEKSLYSMLFLSYNCSAKICLADLKGVPLIGLNSHKLNTAIEYWIKEHPGLSALLKTVDDLMFQLKTLKSAKKLRNLTHLGKMLTNDTRWSVF